MKTLNVNPLFQNQPLRLDEAQTQYPESAFDDFFQSYHLCDVRAIMWQWLTEILSSPRESINDPHERNNDIFFYEKVEALVEAAWGMRRGSSQQIKLAFEIPAKPTSTPDTNALKAALSKPPRLIEKATTQPIEVINEVFDQASLTDLTEYLLPNWLRVALINTQSPYSSGNGREVLYEFYELLLPLIEALSSINDSALDKKSDHLTTDQMPLFQIVSEFFQQCPIDYLRRELSDFLEAGIGHDGVYPNGFTPWQAWMTYNHILCLTEAAYRLSIDPKKQAVLDAHAALMEELEK